MSVTTTVSKSIHANYSQVNAHDPTSKAVDGSLTFKEVVNGLQAVYPKKAMDDISTSYCFICLLHLANEKGLVIDNQENFDNLTIRKDFTADLSVDSG
jgi:condensin complex subunit 2